MNNQLNFTAQERMRDRDQAEIADLSKPLGRDHYMPLPRTPEYERLNSLACDAMLRQSQWGSVAATIKERQNYLRWQAELQVSFTDEMRALLNAQAEALEAGFGTAVQRQKEQADEYKRIQGELLNERARA
jgi:hypothetical protein